ncbi:MAG: carbohydrate kinase family protein, partial [Anaerolineaceae bacterium]|nr:carbohydrate kinase family protein [Anaerolineaceae bacterium]
LSADIVLKTPGDLIMGEKTLVEYTGLQPGGFVGNAACATSKLGLQTTWSGDLGKDMYAQVLLESFAEFNVNTDLVFQDPQIQTNFCIVMLHEDGDRTILIIHTHENPPPLTPEVLDALKSCKISYSPPYKPDWFKPYAEAVHSGAGRVAIDLETSSGLSEFELEQVISQTDIVFSNTRGIQRLGQPNLEQNIEKIRALGCSFIVLTRGADGSSLYSTEGVVHADGFSSNVVDTTGAGDCFHAAFMKGLLESWEHYEILKYANAAAALCIQELGPRNGLPTHQEILDFIHIQNN